MTLASIGSLADKTRIDEIEIDVLEIKSSKPGQYGTMFNVAVADGGTRGFATFSLKKWDPTPYVGKRIRLKTSHNNAGDMTGIRTDANGQYMNLWVTDSAKVEVIGGAGGPGSALLGGGAAQGSPPAAPARPAAPPRKVMPSDQAARHMANEWCAVYDWTADIFAGKLGDADGVRECVTSVMIQLRRENIEILPPPRKRWQDVEVKGTGGGITKLGTWEASRLKNALIVLWRGQIPPGEVHDGLLDVSKEKGFSPYDVYGFMLNKEGIDDDVADTILLRDTKEINPESDDEMVINVIKDGKFLEDCKEFMANKQSSLDTIPEL